MSTRKPRAAIAAVPPIPKSDSYVRIMVTAGSGITSRVIEYWGGGGWSHMTNLLPDGSVIDARSDVVTFEGQSFKPGVQHRPKGYLEAECDRWMVLEIACTADQARKRDELLWSQIDKPYDFIGIRDFATGSLKDRNWRDQSAWFCSELGVWTLEQSGICPALDLPVFKITPGDGLLISKALGAKIIAEKGIKIR